MPELRSLVLPLRTLRDGFCVFTLDVYRIGGDPGILVGGVPSAL